MAASEAVYLDRLAAIQSTLDYHAGRQQPFPRTFTAKCLIRRLHQFGTNHFNFFRDYYVPASVNLEDYPREYAFALILDQISCDLEAVERAMNQRILGCTVTTAGAQAPRFSVDSCVAQLALADVLAWRALRPARDAGFFDSQAGQCEGSLTRLSTALTYFQKSLNIRMIPYAPVALIGVPYNCLSVARDFLAIPHEIGHYVYRHGQVAKHVGQDRSWVLREFFWKELDRRLPADQDKRHWAEEIFADVYGCLCAGPVLALDFQDLQLEESKEGFIRDDGAHPVPAVRPWVYQYVLNYLLTHFGLWPRSCPALQARWEQQFKQRRDEYDLTLEQIARLQDDRTNVEKIASIVLDILNPANPLDHKIQALVATPWCDDLGGSNPNPEALYGSFEVMVSAINPDDPAQQCPDDISRDLDDQLRYDLTQWDHLLAGLEDIPREPLSPWHQWALARGFSATASPWRIARTPQQLTADDWLDLLRADGWVTKGPRGAPISPGATSGGASTG